MDNCRRCWVHIDSWLWCKKCRARVDEELDWDISRPFEYYMRWWIKKKKSLSVLYSNNKNKWQWLNVLNAEKK